MAAEKKVVEIERYLQAASSVGCEEQQVRNFLSGGYVALPSMLPFHVKAREADKGEIRELLLDGTRGSAKSHAIIAQVCLDDCVRAPGIKGLFLRQTERAASESFLDLISKVLTFLPHDLNTERLALKNGSVVRLGGYRDDRDVNRYVGIEYDLLVLEEATQISGDKYERLLGSVRTSRIDWAPRVYLSTNPGGVGHAYYRERFVIPEREGTQSSTWRMFTSYKNNPFLDAGYKRYLESLTGTLAQFWRDGNWDMFAGQAFPQFSLDTHVVIPFDIPPYWIKWRAVDWGYSAPMCCLWFAKNPDNGHIYIYRELYKAGLTDRQQARTILEMTSPGEEISYSFADPSMWTAKTAGDNITSTADEYRICGVYLQKADNNRLSGKRKIDRMLAAMEDGIPGIQIFSTCRNLIRTMQTLAYDPINVEDIDTDMEDHAYDALRYGLTNVRDTPMYKRAVWRSPYERVSVL